jgi:hypothetical protein
MIGVTDVADLDVNLMLSEEADRDVMPAGARRRRKSECRRAQASLVQHAEPELSKDILRRALQLPGLPMDGQDFLEEQRARPISPQILDRLGIGDRARPGRTRINGRSRCPTRRTAAEWVSSPVLGNAR